MLVISTFSIPKAFSSGANDIARPTVVQFGLVTIMPFHPRRFLWIGIRARCSGFTSGINKGTSGSMR
jgi:hypothetical protein